MRSLTLAELKIQPIADDLSLSAFVSGDEAQTFGNLGQSIPPIAAVITGSSGKSTS
ncbi:hypothetical protein MOKP4_50210 [Mycobacterium avium subsp. hominissuis]